MKNITFYLLLVMSLTLSSWAQADTAQSCSQIVSSASHYGLDVPELVRSLVRTRKADGLSVNKELISKFLAVMYAESSGNLGNSTAHAGGTSAQRNYSILQLSPDMVQNYASRGINQTFARYISKAKSNPKAAALACGTKDVGAIASLGKSCSSVGTACFISWVRKCPAISFDIAMDNVYGKTCQKAVLKTVGKGKKRRSVFSHYVKAPCEIAYFGTWGRTVKVCNSQVAQWAGDTKTRMGDKEQQYASEDPKPKSKFSFWGH